MHARGFLWLVLGWGFALAGALAAQAAPPWNKIVRFKQVEAKADELYPIADTNGPWMIMAASFSGPGSEEQARQLVHELRKDFKLPAYSYRKSFDYSKPVRGKGLTPQGEAPLMRYRRNEDVEEIAVMVGDFTAIDDPEAQRALKKVKFARPKSLEIDPEKSHQSLSTYRSLQRKAQEVLYSGSKEEKPRGPMHNAFVVTNPILPPEYFVPKGIDKLVVEMNKGVPHSLLDCKQPFTVQVATFTGHAVILDQKRIEAMQRGEMPKSYLEDAAKNAHLLTEILRKHGFEAYEFHDRNSSIVTVGGFASVGSKRQDGKIEINPAVHKIMLTFGPDTKVEPGKPPAVGKAKLLSDIVGKQTGKNQGLNKLPFDMAPMPVEVPRMAISNVYDRTARANR